DALCVFGRRSYQIRPRESQRPVFLFTVRRSIFCGDSSRFVVLAGQDEAGRVCLGDLFAILVCICYSAALRHMGFCRLVFAFLSIRSFHAVRTAPVSTSSLAAARRICVCPIFPQPSGIGRKISGASSTNAACCSGVSIRFPYPPACEASEANFLPPPRKAGNPAWEYSSTLQAQCNPAKICCGHRVTP